MYKIGKYRKNDSIVEIVSSNYQMLWVMSRFGIEFGVEDRSVQDVCEANGVSVETFLAVANLFLHLNDPTYRVSLDGMSVDDLVKYLHNSHSYYLGKRLPAIREKLLQALNDSEISKLIIRYFDDYVAHIKEHLKYEESVVFPYVNQLSDDGCNSKAYSIDTFELKHDSIDEPLNEFKNVIIKYYKGGGSDMVEVVTDILHCSNDLLIHNMVEDRLLVPFIKKMEEQNNVEK